MKQMKHTFIFIVILGLVFVFGMCRKANPGKVTVTVVNGSYVDTDSLIPSVTKVTNSSGRVEFYKDYDCILNLKATYIDPNDIKYTGKGIGIFKLDEEYETTIELK